MLKSLTLAALLALSTTSAAFAQQPVITPLPGETDLQLAVQAKNANDQQLSRALGEFANSLMALKQQAAQDHATSAYWHDACQSTRQCGGGK